jgi:hypothetical protein
MRIDTKSFAINDQQPECKFYTLSGQEDFYDEEGYPRSKNENNSFAKAVKNKPSKHITNTVCAYRYYIQTDPNNTIVDPVVLYTIERNKDSFINKVCKNTNSFTEVSQSVFNKYIKYLETQHSHWLTSAQREIR